MTEAAGAPSPSAAVRLSRLGNPLRHGLLGTRGPERKTSVAEAVSVLEQHLVVAAARRHFRAGRRRRAGGGLFTRFTEDARGVVVAAQNEARVLGHGHVGSGYLLLGLLVHGTGAGPEALRKLGQAAVLQTLALEGHRFETRPLSFPEFRFVELEGSTGEWEARLNEVAAQGFELVEIVDRRAIFRCE